jgi:pyruvate dehydrogenase E2 component (dihydrolipoamide acetyltransferase)
MATPVIMPRQGQTVESCIITQWHKKVGEKVAVGDILFSYETDKAAFDETSTVGGIMLAQFFEEGADVPVLTNVCVIGEQGEDASAFAPEGYAGTATKPSATQAGAAGVDATTAPTAPNAADVSTPAQSAPAGIQVVDGVSDSRLRISPRARALAERAGIDYSQAQPTGPRGRIIERDIVSLIASPAKAVLAVAGGKADEAPAKVPAAEQAKVTVQPVAVSAKSDYDSVPLTNIRKRIAEAMHRSLSTTAQLTIHSSFDATEILAYRKVLKASSNSAAQSITLTDIVLYAVARTLINHRPLNAHLVDDKMLLFRHVNLGVAVDTERGLMVPTIFEADQKSLSQISAEAKRLAEECRSGSINPDALQGGTFTVTNLGSLGVEYFTPVLNPPQTAILGVNTIVQRVKQTEDGVAYYPAMGLSLTFDHRAVDGAPAARFLKELVSNLEHFSVLLAL